LITFISVNVGRITLPTLPSDQSTKYNMKFSYLISRNPYARALNYLPLSDKEDSSLSRQLPQISGRIIQLLLLAAVALTSGCVGAVIGRLAISHPQPGAALVDYLSLSMEIIASKSQLDEFFSNHLCTADLHISSVEQTFNYNKTFGADPATDDNNKAAWDSIVPSENAAKELE
jgi:hypothetical protein